MKAVFLILSLFLASSASAFDLSCSRSLADLNWETPVKIAHGKAHFSDGTLRVVHIRKSHPPKSNQEYTELRVSSGDWEWSMMCIDAVQRRALGL